MSNTFDIFLGGKAGSIQAVADKYRLTHPWLPDNNTLNNNILWKTYEADDYNFIMNVLDNTDTSGVAFTFGCRTVKLKFTAPDGWRGCFVKFPNNVQISGTTETTPTESLVLVSVTRPDFSGGVNISSFPDSTPNTTYTYAYDNGTFANADNTLSRTVGARWNTLNSDSAVSEWVYSRYSGTVGGINHHNITDEQKADIFSKLKAIVGGLTEGYTLVVQKFAMYGEPQFNLNDWGMLGGEITALATYEQIPFPIFDYTQVDDIVKYINTGDDSGKLDPYDKNNPDKEVIDDYKTNYRIFVSPWEGDKRKTKFTAIAYNTQLIENFDNLSKDYAMSVYEADGQGNFPLLQQTPMEKYPTVGWYVKINGEYTNSFVFGERGEYSEVEHDMPIYVYWAYKEDSAVNCRVTDVMRGLEHFSKSNILDGYRYTGSNGQYVEILFRTPTMDDLSGGYSPKEDHEDDKSGTDSDFSGASGLRTFSINNTDFETINKKLWSTDWTTVFKSSSIDPVKCVISCKGIPFTADNVSSAEVIIANMNTGLNKNYVKSVKSFNVGSVLMPHYNDDFTDITLTHIRCYLPYIGWVELPASECISRVAYSKVGIEARPKRLKFKYLVDFVDGSVRCVVSVNDTERWFFDGNCSVDIPVTSDNHTQAVSNALRSGLQTGLSIATAVAGAYTSNAGAVAGGVIGAMQNAPNIFPTYSYTATANGSGYINASMNTHIMIVIERPNTIKSTDYAKRVGVPCGLSLNLGSLHGFTVCKEVDVTGIDATPDELSMIKSLLESGVYL